MSSTFLHATQMLDGSAAQSGPRNGSPSDNQTYDLDNNHLSPFSQMRARSKSASPTLTSSNTPAESIMSIHYQSSEFSDLDVEIDNDPFFGVDFSTADGGTPSFLDEGELFPDAADAGPQSVGSPEEQQDLQGVHRDSETYPLSPEKTPSLHTTSPQQHARGIMPPGTVTPKDLSKRPLGLVSVLDTHVPSQSQLTPDTNTSADSSDDQLTSQLRQMQTQSPRVTVSMWGRDNHLDMPPPLPAADDNTPNMRAGMSLDDSAVTRGATPDRDSNGRWSMDADVARHGLDPESRPTAEVTSVNDLDKRRKVKERNHSVGQWLSDSTTACSPDELTSPANLAEIVAEGVSNQEIGLGDQTENIMQPGRSYFTEGAAGGLSQEDIEIIRQNRNWGDGPVLRSIYKPSNDSPRHQPETSAEAMRRFEEMWRDTDSTFSRAATWGTRRRSLPSIADMEGITSGNFLKKLSLSRGDTRRPSIFKDLRGLVRRPSATHKRSRAFQEDEGSNSPTSPDERRDSSQTLAPSGRAGGSWGKLKAMPSINTALVSMGSNAASIGTGHARSGSISTSPRVTSPKSTFGGLRVSTSMRRSRSKSDVTKPTNDRSHPTLVNMLREAGGPPVASLVRTTSAPELDEEEDEDDELEGSDGRVESLTKADDIIPTIPGFQQHILKLNPTLESSPNRYLVERIAHQQMVRYKYLLNLKLKHITCVRLGNCSCGELCIALGGRANILDSKGDPRGVDPLSAHLEASDGDVTPLEGVLGQDSFPSDIPLPPAQRLPAEFECQLCFQSKTFHKPSDWTKHVHEDVQPFTCTWERCKENKIFKRKADWVRHENEGHRHLECWRCDVDDCSHVCYRRDNFLQHLVREHKYAEPKIKTKAAIKKAGGPDPTWQKVEMCRGETPNRPQDEPCRFCGKTLPSWKKLTVHLAKHMEQISLPVIELVSRKVLEPDTLISPVQDPPPRNFGPLPTTNQEAPRGVSHHAMQPEMIRSSPNTMLYQSNQQPPFVYPGAAPPYAQPAFYVPQYGHPNPSSMMGGLHNSAMSGLHPIDTGFAHSMSTMVDGLSTGYGGGGSASRSVGGQEYMTMDSGLEPFPAFSQMNALGLRDTTAATATINSGSSQLGYDPMLDLPNGVGVEHYTPQGSVSPYSRSPHQPQMQYYGP